MVTALRARSRPRTSPPRKLPNGRTLTHDAGSIRYEVSFDASDNVTGVEVVSVHGPHPAFDSDVWCDTAVEALGL